MLSERILSGRRPMIGNNHHVILADLNDDGLPDLIHTDGRSTVRVSLNNISRTPRCHEARLGSVSRESGSVLEKAVESENEN